MFKTVVFAALGLAAVSAQFLNERDLQAATAFSALCTFTGGVDSCGAGYCCARYTRAGAAPAAPFVANVCAPTDFIGQTITIGGVATAFTSCLNANATVAPRQACNATTTCPVGSCCTNVTLSAGLSTALGTTVRQSVCNDPTKLTAANATYAAAAWSGAAWVATVTAPTCTAVAAPVDETGSFGSYIKASVMMVAALISVAMF